MVGISCCGFTDQNSVATSICLLHGPRSMTRQLGFRPGGEKNRAIDISLGTVLPLTISRISSHLTKIKYIVLSPPCIRPPPITKHPVSFWVDSSNLPT